MTHILADSGLAPWGQAAAFVLLLYLFLSIVVGLVLTMALMLALVWLHEKTELIRKFRPWIDEVNRTAVAAREGEALPPGAEQNQVLRTVAQVPRVAASLSTSTSKVEQRVEQGSDRVAGAVIEFRARTMMAKTIVREFFLPGLRRATVHHPRETPIVLEREPAPAEASPSAAIDAEAEHREMVIEMPMHRR